jgi:hypothetical protein
MTQETPTPCACLGPQGGDLYCPCVMRSLGLEPSNKWTHADRERLVKLLEETIFKKNKEKK